MKSELKDWQIAQMMFGKNTKKECKLVADLRKHGVVEELCEGWSTVNKILDNIGKYFIYLYRFYVFLKI